LKKLFDKTTSPTANSFMHRRKKEMREKVRINYSFQLHPNEKNNFTHETILKNIVWQKKHLTTAMKLL